MYLGKIKFLEVADEVDGLPLSELQKCTALMISAAGLAIDNGMTVTELEEMLAKVRRGAIFTASQLAQEVLTESVTGGGGSSHRAPLC